MPAAHRRPAAVSAAVLLLLGTTTACSLLAVPADRVPHGAPATVRPPKQVLLSAVQTLEDSGGARIRVVEEGPAGRRGADGVLAWGATDTAELTVTDERGTARLTGRDGAFDLAYEDGATAPRHAERADAETLDARASVGPGGYAGGWMTSLVGNPGRPARLMALTGRLTPLGGEQLDGTTVAHYRGTAPVAEFFAAEDGLAGGRLEAVVAHYRERGVVSVGYDFWVAPGDRLLRLKATVQGPQGTVVTTTDVSDPGAGTATATATG